MLLALQCVWLCVAVAVAVAAAAAVCVCVCDIVAHVWAVFWCRNGHAWRAQFCSRRGGSTTPHAGVTCFSPAACGVTWKPAFAAGRGVRPPGWRVRRTGSRRPTAACWWRLKPTARWTRLWMQQWPVARIQRRRSCLRLVSPASAPSRSSPACWTAMARTQRNEPRGVRVPGRGWRPRCWGVRRWRLPWSFYGEM